MNPDGTDLRQLTDNPLDDAQSDWSPDGRDIAYRIRKPETPTVNFEVARMSASGTDHRRLTFTPSGQASSQPTWFPDKSAILFRWSAPRVSNIWQMGPLGENPVLRYDPTGEAPVVSEPRARHEQGALRQHDLADRRHGPFDPDAQCRRHRPHHAVRRGRVPSTRRRPGRSTARKIAFESDANLNGGNPEGDREIWVMNADGSNPTQLTHNALWDEGPAWSPDGTLIAYSSGSDNDHLDINVMTAGGAPATLTDYPGHDESPDWQPIPAPPTDRRCGDSTEAGPGVRDVRAAGKGSPATRRSSSPRAGHARHTPETARQSSRGSTPTSRTSAARSELCLPTAATTRDDTGNDKLVAFLYQP